MARVIKTTNHLEDEIVKIKKRRRLWLLTLIISLILFIPTVGLTLPILALSGYKFYKSRNDTDIVTAGLEGEKQAQYIFKKLPRMYTVISDLSVEVEGHTSQIDNVLVGPNGVFVVETKHINGKIVGKSEDQKLIQYKIGRKGGKYSKAFYNPVKQVGTHVYRLSTMLKEEGFNTWVQGVVYFSNPRAKVYVAGGTIPVFSSSYNGSQKFYRYIMKQRAHTLTRSDQSKIIRLLESKAIRG